MMRSLCGWILGMLFVLAGPFLAADEKKQPAKFEMTKDEKALLDLLNAERAKEKLPALRPNPLLFQAARTHAANMAKQRKMEHELDGKKPSDRVSATGYNWGRISENLAISENGVAPLTEIVKCWMESKTHRENLLDKGVSETGLGIARNDKDETYYAQVFARQRGVRKKDN
jgi:uncharacterized protein YkwD